MSSIRLNFTQNVANCTNYVIFEVLPKTRINVKIDAEAPIFIYFSVLFNYHVNRVFTYVYRHIAKAIGGES